MRFVLRVSSLIVVSLFLYLFLQAGVGDEPTPEEKAAYRDWAVSMAEEQQAGWDEYYDIDDPDRTVDYDYEPYADPDLYGAGRVVLDPGDTWTGRIVVHLPGGSDSDPNATAGRYPGDPQIGVLRNELSPFGLRVDIEDVRTEAYVYPTWELSGKRGHRTLAHRQTEKGARYTGALSRQQIAAELADGVKFNLEGFDPEFDLIRGQGSGWRAHVRYRITVPGNAPVRVDDRSLWGQFTIQARDGGQPYKAHLIHLESFEGIALRPIEPR